jgi:chaperonin GroEL
MGQLIADAMEKVGKEGVITVKDGNTLETELEVVEGMKFDRGFISPYFVTDNKTQTCEMEDPAILLVEKKVSNLQALLPLLEEINKSSCPLVIIAEDVEGEALAALVVNRLQGALKVVAVKAPGFGDNRKATLEDISILTGATVISEDAGIALKDATLEHCGRCKSISITKDETVVLDGAGSGDSVEGRVQFLRDQTDGEGSEYAREKPMERLAKLPGGIAVIKVGGASEVEVREKKDRATDALNATRAAVEEGTVPGGGRALLYSSTQLAGVKDECDNLDQRIGVEIVERALQAPATTIANNAGEQGAVIVGKMLESDDPSYGYDAQNMVYVNMIDAGIIDPAKVVKTALIDAAGVASLMLTTEAMICDYVEEDDNAGA